VLPRGLLQASAAPSALNACSWCQIYTQATHQPCLLAQPAGPHRRKIGQAAGEADLEAHSLPNSCFSLGELDLVYRAHDSRLLVPGCSYHHQHSSVTPNISYTSRLRLRLAFHNRLSSHYLFYDTGYRCSITPEPAASKSYLACIHWHTIAAERESKRYSYRNFP